MKKIFALAIASLMSLGASAQLISSNTMTYHKEKGKNYNRLGVSYSSISPDVDGADAVSGLSLSWTKGISVSGSLPLFVETGVGATYGFDDPSPLILSVPVNVTYKIPVTSKINIAPLLGVTLNGNLASDDDDMKYFAMGWQVGANFEFGKFYVGLGYGGGFMDFANSEDDYDGYYDHGYKYKLNAFSATVGIVF